MAILWPAGAENLRQSALDALRTASEAAANARRSGGPDRLAYMADCRAALSVALVDVRQGRLYSGGRADRWSPMAKARAELAELSIGYARERMVDAWESDDPALASALLAEVAALCADAVVYLSIF